MSTAALAIAEAVGHGAMRAAVELASLAWLVIIGIPETVAHVGRLISWCRGMWSRCLDHIAHAAAWTFDDKETNK